MKIGIVGSANGPNSFGVGKSYAELALHLGEVCNKEVELEIVAPWSSKERSEHNAKELDLLILPGGADLSPRLYGEDPHPFTGNPDVFKEHFFSKKLPIYIENGCPIFGICLGFQMLNVYFGGKLIQHLKGSWLHQDSVRGTESHQVLNIGTGRTFGVNSHHHQGVNKDTLAKELVPTVLSFEHIKEIKNPDMDKRSKDVLVEGFRHPKLPVAGVQWHPEEWFDNYSILEMIRLAETRIKNRTKVEA